MLTGPYHLLLLLPISLWAAPLTDSNSKKLLIVSYDGFGNEYFHRNVTAFMDELRQNGTSTDYVRNVFPTKTFPNHFSIATGLFPKEHGVMANIMFDKKLGRLAYSYEMFHYRNDVLPIWALNEITGQHTGCSMWPGSDFGYKGMKNCTHTEIFNKSRPWHDRVDTMISWFMDPQKPINLGLLYIEDPDSTSHPYGTGATVTDVVRRLDELTKYIQDRLAANRLDINVIHLSDHGMANSTPQNFINLTSYIGENTATFYGTSPVLQLVPIFENSTEKLYDQLSRASKLNGNFKVYTEETLPERWKFQNKDRTGPLTVVAELGYAFQDMWVAARYYEKAMNITVTANHTYGMHGYDNQLPSMRSFFMAKGPKIKDHHQVPPFDTVDLFDLFCEILEIEKATQTSGRRENIMDILVHSDKERRGHISKVVIMLISSIISFILVSLVAALVVVHMRRKRESLVPQYLYEEPDTIIEGQKLLNTTVASAALSNDAEV